MNNLKSSYPIFIQALKEAAEKLKKYRKTDTFSCSVPLKKLKLKSDKIAKVDIEDSNAPKPRKKINIHTEETGTDQRIDVLKELISKDQKMQKFCNPDKGDRMREIREYYKDDGRPKNKLGLPRLFIKCLFDTPTKKEQKIRDLKKRSNSMTRYLEAKRKKQPYGSTVKMFQAYVDNRVRVHSKNYENFEKIKKLIQKENKRSSSQYTHKRNDSQFREADRHASMQKIKNGSPQKKVNFFITGLDNRNFSRNNADKSFNFSNKKVILEKDRSSSYKIYSRSSIIQQRDKRNRISASNHKKRLKKLRKTQKN